VRLAIAAVCVLGCPRTWESSDERTHRTPSLAESEHVTVKVVSQCSDEVRLSARVGAYDSGWTVEPGSIEELDLQPDVAIFFFVAGHERDGTSVQDGDRIVIQSDCHTLAKR
jgi:hypothetical protein